MSNFKVVPHPKLKRDYVNRKVRTTRELSNGYGVVPIGSIATINNQSPTGSTLFFEKCSCCSVAMKMLRVCKQDIEFIENIEDSPTKTDDKWVSDPDARKRLKKRFSKIKNTFDDLSEDEYGDWLNSLPSAEFFELVDMCG